MTVHKSQSERPDEHEDQPAKVTEMPAEPDTAPVTNLRPTVGDELRRRREETGQTIEEVSEAIRVQKRFLQALEDGRIDHLPGTVYAIGFLRTYAEHFGLDGDEFVARFKEETEGQRQEQDYTLPEPIEDARVPTAAMFILAILLAVGAYVAWYNFWPENRDTTASVPDVPAELAGVPELPAPAQEPSSISAQPTSPDTTAAPEPAPAAADAIPAAPPPAVEADSQPVEEAPLAPPPAAEEPAEPVEASGNIAEPPVEAQPSETPAEEAPVAESEVAATTPPEATQPDMPAAPEVAAPVHEPLTYGAANTGSRIVISAVEDSWIEVTDAEGNRLLSRTLRTGDSYRVPNREGLVFVTGNAGGLAITVDGVSVPALGDTGIVRKNVKLDPELLKQGRAWP